MQVYMRRRQLGLAQPESHVTVKKDTKFPPEAQAQRRLSRYARGHMTSPYDRFIPRRVAGQTPSLHRRPETKREQALSDALMPNETKRVLNNVAEHKRAEDAGAGVDIKASQGRASPRASPRTSPHPEKRLDLPKLWDNFYTHLIDWSAKDCMAVALRNKVYLLDGADGGHRRLCALEDDQLVSVVSFSPTGKRLAVVSLTGVHQPPIVTVFAGSEVVRDLGHFEMASLPKAKASVGCRPHKPRHFSSLSQVGAVSWNSDDGLTLGSRDASIRHLDLRMPETQMAWVTPKAHEGEVCALQWSPDRRVLASGGNDNRVKLWDARRTDKPSLILVGTAQAALGLISFYVHRKITRQQSRPWHGIHRRTIIF